MENLTQTAPNINFSNQNQTFSATPDSESWASKLSTPSDYSFFSRSAVAEIKCCWPMQAGKYDDPGIPESWAGGFADSGLPLERLTWAVRRLRSAGNKYAPSLVEIIDTARHAGITDAEAEASLLRCINLAAAQNWPSMSRGEYRSMTRWGASLPQTHVSAGNIQRWRMLLADAVFDGGLPLPPPRPAGMLPARGNPELARSRLAEIKALIDPARAVNFATNP